MRFRIVVMGFARIVLMGLALFGVLVACGPSGAGDGDPRLAGIDLSTSPPELAEQIDLAREKVRAHPEHAGNWGSLGLLLLANDLAEPAIGFLEEARARSPESVKWSYFLARALRRDGRHAEALAAAVEGARAGPDEFLIWLLRGELELEAGKLDEALASFGRARALDGADPRPLVGLARALGSSGRDEEALPHLEELRRRLPGDGYVLGLYGNALRRLGRAEEARAALARSGGEPPAGDRPWEIELGRLRVETRLSRWQHAQALLDAGRPDEALELVEALAAEDPDDLAVQVFLGNTLARLGDFAEAERVLQRVLELEPGKREALVDLAAVLGERGRLPLALETIARAIELHPRFGEARRVQGVLLRRAGEREAAVAAFERALELDERDPELLVDLGNTLLDLGRAEEALERLEQAAREGLDSGDLHLTLSRGLLELGRLEEAEASLVRAGERGDVAPAALERMRRRLARARERGGESGG